MKKIKFKMILAGALLVVCILGTTNALAATYSTENWQHGYTTTGSVTLVSKITDDNTKTKVWKPIAPDYQYEWVGAYVDVTGLYWTGSYYDNYRTLYSLYDNYEEDLDYSGAQSTGKLQFYNREQYGDYMWNTGTFT